VVLEATVKAERNNASRQGSGGTDQGFSLIEVMISIALLTIGLLSLLGIFGVAMAATQTSQENNTAKLLADGAMEGILTARETANINWSQINNTGSGGIFLPGFLPIDCAGVDGIIGTADDAACGPQTLELPGPNGVFAGNCPAAGPDTCLPLTNFTRQILISPVFPAGGGPASTTLRQVTITIQYTLPQFNVPRQYVLNTYISPYR
jgi:prepilin-type N-terminal cleavage/methylation domain-containing protein